MGFKVGILVILVGLDVGTKEGLIIIDWVGFKDGTAVLPVGLVVDNREGIKVGN